MCSRYLLCKSTLRRCTLSRQCKAQVLGNNARHKYWARLKATEAISGSSIGPHVKQGRTSQRANGLLKQALQMPQPISKIRERLGEGMSKQGRLLESLQSMLKAVFWYGLLGLRALPETSRYCTMSTAEGVQRQLCLSFHCCLDISCHALPATAALLGHRHHCTILAEDLSPDTVCYHPVSLKKYGANSSNTENLQSIFMFS